jgi:hypothetical protein
MLRFIYLLATIAPAFAAVAGGALVGGVMVYRLAPLGNLPGVAVSKVETPGTTAPAGDVNRLQVSGTEVETAVTAAVEKIGPTVVTVVGIVPGQATFFGPTGNQRLKVQVTLGQTRS